jgi:hypothetical protein
MVLVLNAEDGQVVDGDAGGQSPPEGAVFGMEALAKWALPSDALVFAEGPKGPAKGGVDRPGGSGGSGGSTPAAFGGVEAMASGLPSGLSRGKKGSSSGAGPSAGSSRWRPRRGRRVFGGSCERTSCCLWGSRKSPFGSSERIAGAVVVLLCGIYELQRCTRLQDEATVENGCGGASQFNGRQRRKDRPVTAEEAPAEICSRRNTWQGLRGRWRRTESVICTSTAEAYVR